MQASNETLESLYPQAYAWCVQTQKELAPQNYKTISYKIESCWKACAAHCTIYLPQDAAQNLEHLTQKQNISASEKIQLQKYKGLLAHEIGHILYDNEPLHLAIMLSTSAFLLYCTDYIVQDTGLLIRLFTFIFTSATSLYGTNFLRKQYQEIQADTFVINTKNFDAIAGLYQDLEAGMPHNLFEACLHNAQHTNNILSKLYYHCCSWICAQSWVPEDIKYILWDQEHPSHLSRIEKLKQALTCL